MKYLLIILCLAIVSLFAIQLVLSSDTTNTSVDDQIEADDSDFKWFPDKIKFEIKRDDKYLKLGQYLHLTQDVEYGWTMSKIDIPETWQINSIAFDKTNLILTLNDKRKFVINSTNFGSLDVATMELSEPMTMPKDAELDAVWVKFATLKR